TGGAFYPLPNFTASMLFRRPRRAGGRPDVVPRLDPAYGVVPDEESAFPGVASTCGRERRAHRRPRRGRGRGRSARRSPVSSTGAAAGLVVRRPPAVPLGRAPVGLAAGRGAYFSPPATRDGLPRPTPGYPPRDGTPGRL